MLLEIVTLFRFALRFTQTDRVFHEEYSRFFQNVTLLHNSQIRYFIIYIEIPIVCILSLVEQSKVSLVSYTAARLSDFDSPSSEGSTLQDPESFALKFLAPEFKPPSCLPEVRTPRFPLLSRETNTSCDTTIRAYNYPIETRDIIRDVTLAVITAWKEERAAGTIYL